MTATCNICFINILSIPDQRTGQEFSSERFPACGEYSFHCVLIKTSFVTGNTDLDILTDLGIAAHFLGMCQILKMQLYCQTPT